MKLRQDSGDLGSFFVAFKCSKVQSRNSLQTVIASVEAVSIHSMSQQRFLILDSNGDLHLFSLHNSATGSELFARSCIPSRNGCMRRLNYTMKVQLLAVRPDTSKSMLPLLLLQDFSAGFSFDIVYHCFAGTQTIWISDGCYSLHVMSFTDIEVSASESNNDGSDGKLMQNSGLQKLYYLKSLIIPSVYGI